MEKKVKVLIVHNYYQIPGGEDTVVENEKKLLEGHGHEVVLYSRNNSELKCFSKMQKLFLPITTVFNPETYKEVKRIIRENNIDIVHVHNTLSLISPSVYYAAFSCKVPVVQTIHNFRLLCPGAAFYRDGHICEDCISKGLGCAVKNGCYRGSKLQTLACAINTWIHRKIGTYGKLNYICLTEFNKEKLLELNRPNKKQIINPEKVFVKPNFTFQMPAHENGGGTSEFDICDYFLFVGRVEKIKGIDILIEAFSRMPDKTLVIAGTGPQKDEYQRKSTENVRYIGFVDRTRLAGIIRNAKAVILPSQVYEGFPMTIVEAFSAHKPVIGTNLGNVAVLIEDDVTGVKFENTSSEKLEKAIKHYEKLDVVALGENAYIMYEQEYSPEANYRHLVRIYQSCLDGVVN